MIYVILIFNFKQFQENIVIFKVETYVLKMNINLIILALVETIQRGIVITTWQFYKQIYDMIIFVKKKFNLKLN